jgi:hypothetical protein
MARYAKFFSLGGGGGTNNLQLPVGTILDATLRQVQDGLGTGSPLYLSTRRVGITSDSSVTTQTSSIIQATTTNANLVIAPNGTGALVASIPDGTATGGNARGINAVDLQRSRVLATEVAQGNYAFIGSGHRNTIGTGSYSAIVTGNENNISSGSYSFIGTGNENRIDSNVNYSSILNGFFNNIENNSDYAVISGGRENVIGGNIDNDYAVISGGRSNRVDSQYSTVSGGQSNTASTGTHATVVGGSTNTSSGLYSVSGGFTNTASNTGSVALGYASVASGTYSVALGLGNYATANRSMAIGAGGNSYLTRAFSIGNSGAIAPFYGVIQQTLLTSYSIATLTSNSTSILSLDGSGINDLIIPDGTNRMWKVKVEWVATVTTITGTATGITVGDYVYGESSFGFKKLAGTSTMGNMLSDSEASDNAIMDTCLMTYTAGASQELALTFTGPTFSGGGSVTMRVVAKVALVEVAF